MLPNTDELFDELCQARDRLEAGPAEGPERTELFSSYVDTRVRVYKLAERWARERRNEKPYDPVPRLNRRFLVMNLHQAQYVDFQNEAMRSRYTSGGCGFGWADVRALPPPLLQREQEDEDHRSEEPQQDDEIRWSHSLPKSPILSSRLLSIWRGMDAEALDSIPVRVMLRPGGPEDRNYSAVDVVRLLPALDEARMGLRRFRHPFPHHDGIGYFPLVEAIALREDLPVDGVHVFRDEIERDRLFVSVALARACYEAGAGTVYPLFAWPDMPYVGVNLKNLSQYQ